MNHKYIKSSLIVISAFLCFACSQDPKSLLKDKGIEFTEDDLVEQVVEGNKATVELFIQAGMDVNHDDGKVGPLLFSAIQAGNAEMVEFLLKQGADPNIANANTNTALIKLTREREDLDILNLLVSYGADVNKTNSSKSTPLMYAINRNYMPTAVRLLELGAECLKPNDQIPPLTPILLAAGMNHVGVLEGLLSRGADVNSVNSNGTSVLLMALNQKAYPGVLETLLKYGADIHKRDHNQTSALMKVIKNGNLHNMNVLLKAGAKKDEVNSVGRGILYYAIESKSLEVLKAVADIEGIDINQKDNYNTTPLIRAAQYGDVNMVKYLVDRGADVSVVDTTGYTALKYAEDAKAEEVIAYLTEIEK